MRIKTPKCPECGKELRGTVEEVTGVALVSDQGDGDYQYDGETDMDWNTQVSVKDQKGRMLLNCGEHEWYSEVEE